MTNFLTWIGNTYYPTPQDFIDEAEAMGISRRIAANMAGSIQKGDRVFVTMFEKPGMKSPVVLGYFKVGGVFVATQEMIENTPERGCGSLVLDGEYVFCREAGPLILLPQPWPFLYNMKAFRGFRKFDADTFMTDVLNAKQGERPKLKCFYYA
jgi:hypothetical protein